MSPKFHDSLGLVDCFPLSSDLLCLPSALAFRRANEEDKHAGLIAALAQRQSRGLIERMVALKGNLQMRTG
jgi:hypothetical protein